jgi:hypothetical protein
MRSQHLANRLRPALNTHPTRNRFRIRRLQRVLSLPLVLRKKRPNPKSDRGSSRLIATYCIGLEG